ncbi:hypothetical protein MMC07_007818 [Pseudocyphellaria aurata]|nr:hypothetical protein [Pseudocyphellaria aurata]
MEVRSQAPWRPWARAKPRVIVLESDRGQAFGPVAEYTAPGHLQQHFTKRRVNAGQCFVYILESLDWRFTEVFEANLKLHPALFEDHDRLVPFHGRATGEGGGIPFLPSAICDRGYVSFKYHEPLVLSPTPCGFRTVCEISGRHIAITRLMGKFLDIAAVRRKCTFWSEELDDGGWQCLIVCDPPIKRILTASGEHDVTTSPYNYGYWDFMRSHRQLAKSSGPPRTSFLDDLLFYFQAYAQDSGPTDPEFHQANIEKLQFSFSRRPDLTAFAIAAVEEQWSDIQALERRLNEYQDDIEAIMLQLRIPFGQPVLAATGRWEQSDVDYQFLHLRICEITRRADGLNSAICALADLTNSRQAFRAQDIGHQAAERSLREAKSVKTLTILGVVFIPLSFVAALFSMSDPYRPGGREFWMYFAAALPLTSLTLLGFWVLELGYSKGSMAWSFETVISNVWTKK